MSRPAVSCRVVSCRVVSCCVVFCRVVLCCVVLCGVCMCVCMNNLMAEGSKSNQGKTEALETTANTTKEPSLHGALISIFTLMSILIALPGGLDVLMYIHLQSAPRRDGAGRTSKIHTKKSGSTTCLPQHVVGGVRIPRHH